MEICYCQSILSTDETFSLRRVLSCICFKKTIKTHNHTDNFIGIGILSGSVAVKYEREYGDFALLMMLTTLSNLMQIKSIAMSCQGLCLISVF